MLEEQGQLENFCARLSAAQTELVTEDEALLAATSNMKRDDLCFEGYRGA